MLNLNRKNKMEIKMNKKLLSGAILLVIALISFTLGFRIEGEKEKNVRKVTGNDDFTFIVANQVLMWCSNNGDGSHDPRAGGNGFYWPGGRNATRGAIFEDGLLFGAKIGRDIRVNGNTHRQGLQAGKILAGGVADDPGKDKYRVYRIRKDWQSFSGTERTELEKDYNEWPVEDGAPWEDINGDGSYTVGVDAPKFIGDEVLWYVANDMDASRSTFTYGTLPMGLEFQTTIFAFNRTGPLGDMVFKKYTIINKGSNVLREMYLSYWSDTDMGDAGDDGTGCDTVLSLGYTWNGDNADGIYNDGAPPAVGYDFFQGPVVDGAATDSAKFLGKWIKGKKNLPMTAFAFYINGTDPRYRDPRQGDAQGAIEFYNYMQGFIWNGDQYIDPSTNQPTKFVLPGDPVSGTGWYAGPIGWPGGAGFGDVRHVMSSGPFTMAPGDTQEVVVGIVIARGTDNLKSVTELKIKDKLAQIAYDLDFNLTPAPATPLTHSYNGDQNIVLWWEDNAEDYDANDPLVTDVINVNVNGTNVVINVTDKTFTFEGYRIWQFRDLAGTDPKLLGTYDIVNGVKDVYSYIYDYTSVNGQNNPVVLIQGQNTGVVRSFAIQSDAYTNGPLYNGNPYYFAVTAYGYSKYSDPPFLESPPAIMEIRPGTTAIDFQYGVAQGDSLFATKVAGVGAGKMKIHAVDPGFFTGNTYEVSMQGWATNNDLKYSIVDKTKNDTLATGLTNFSRDSRQHIIYDGFTVEIQNIGNDSLKAANKKSLIRSVKEVKGPGGTAIATPVNVLNAQNSTNEWKMVTDTGSTNPYITLNWKESMGEYDYEIRFTAAGSAYYYTKTTGINPHIKNDSIASDRLPFEVYRIGRSYIAGIPVIDTVRMFMKANDPNLNKNWDQNTTTGRWDDIYVYLKAGNVYNEPLPATSGSISNTDIALKFSFVGSKPATGTVIKIEGWKGLGDFDKFTIVPTAPTKNDATLASSNMDKISVFPNPYFGANSLERDKYQRFVTFTNLPQKATIRIFSLSGVFIQRIEKDNSDQYVRWDLRNGDGLPIASGVYIAYLDIPGIGTKIMKIAVIMETQFIDRL